MHRPSHCAALTFLVAASACTSAGPLGLAAFCYATEATDDDIDTGDFVEIVDERSGLRLVDESEETDPPLGFAGCAGGTTARAQLIDGDGARIFVAVVARYGIRELVQRNHFALLDGGNLRVQKVGGGFSPVRMSFFMSNGDQPIVALQSGDDPAGQDFGVLGVAVDGAFATTRFESCGTADPKNIRFTDDDGAKSSNEGDTVELIVGGVEFSGTNIRAFDQTSLHCEDAGATGIHATWVAADNSL